MLMYAKLYFMVHRHRSYFLSINLVKLHIYFLNQWNNHSKIIVIVRNGDNKGFKPI